MVIGFVKEVGAAMLKGMIEIARAIAERRSGVENSQGRRAAEEPIPPIETSSVFNSGADGAHSYDWLSDRALGFHIEILIETSALAPIGFRTESKNSATCCLIRMRVRQCHGRMNDDHAWR